MKAVLDPNVIISAVLSPRGSPGLKLRTWLEGAYDVVCSHLLLAELERALAYPKLRKYIRAEETEELLDLLRRGALLIDDPEKPSEISSADPEDDYLIALVAESRAVLVSGDSDLLELSAKIPVYSPRAFLSMLEEGS